MRRVGKEREREGWVGKESSKRNRDGTKAIR